LSTLKSEDFFRILVTELRQQDPFEPAKTADMISQVSQIRSIELSKQLTDTLQELAAQQHTAGAAELLGKYVTARLVAADGSEQEVSGVVTGVRFDADGSAVLELDTGQAVPASAIVRVTTVEAAQDAATDEAADTNPRSAASAAPRNDKTAAQSKPRTGGQSPWLSLAGALNL